jgi:hypothetical protein
LVFSFQSDRKYDPKDVDGACTLEMPNKGSVIGKVIDGGRSSAPVG